MKKFHFTRSASAKKARRGHRESAGINIVMTIGSTEMLRNPEFWR